MARRKKVWTKEEIDIVLQMKRAGYTHQQIASFFHFKSAASITEHAKNDESLREALENGRVASVAAVANRLYEKAIGIEFYEDTFEAIVPFKDELEEEALGRYEKAGYVIENMMYLKKRVKKLIPPDTFAMNSFLNNREAEHWKQNRDGDKVVEHKHTILIGGKPKAQLEASAVEKVGQTEDADYVISEGGEGTN